MKTFEDVKPEEVLMDNRVAHTFTRQDETSINGTHFVILIDSNYLIFCRAYQPIATSVNPSRTEWMGGIILEVPLKGFKWLMDAIENKFFKTEAEGGLARGIFSAEIEIEGEKLSISRMFGIPGYSFTNHSRTAHWAARCGLTRIQELELPDDLLFEQGYFNELKIIAGNS